MEVDTSSQPALQSIDQVDSADLLVGLLVDFTREELGTVCDTLRGLPGNPRVVVLQNRAASTPPPAASDPWEHNPRILLIPWSPLTDGAAASPVDGVAAAYESIFATGSRLQVQGCCLVASKLENPGADWVCQLVQPLLEGGCDLVAPAYARRKFEGLLNNGIVSPLTRSLYGKRIQNPMGPDLAISRKLFEQVVAANQDLPASGAGLQLLASLAPAASHDNFRICQSYAGSRSYPPVDWTNVSSLIAEILGAVFLEMERNAARWQQVRNSTAVTMLNELAAPPAQATAAIDTGRLINSFLLGMRDLQEIWRLVLPPATLFELQRVSPEKFRLPDDLWVRIIYDFALAHRLRTINRAHLLRSLTPLYLGWVASYAQEVENADSMALGRRLERLAVAYEAGKPYLISRWRWPDRFNP